jgi:hypothetical protein
MHPGALPSSVWQLTKLQPEKEHFTIEGLVSSQKLQNFDGIYNSELNVALTKEILTHLLE